MNKIKKMTDEEQEEAEQEKEKQMTQQGKLLPYNSKEISMIIFII